MILSFEKVGEWEARIDIDEDSGEYLVMNWEDYGYGTCISAQSLDEAKSKFVEAMKLGRICRDLMLLKKATLN